MRKVMGPTAETLPSFTPQGAIFLKFLALDARPPYPWPVSQQAQESRSQSTARQTPGIAPRKGWDRATLRFLVIFVFLVVVCGVIVRTEWFDRNFLHSYTSFIASLSSRILGLIGVDATVDGTRILSPRFSVEIRKGCDGLEAALLLICATIAYPFSRLRIRLLALTSGYPLIFVLNLIRVVGLFLIGLNRPALVEFVHTYVAQFAIITATMIFWLFWIARDRAEGRRVSPGATTA